MNMKLYILIAICMITNTINAQEPDSLFFQNSLWEYDNRSENKGIHVIEQFYFADDGRFYAVKLVSMSGYYKYFHSGKYEYNSTDKTILLYAENAYDCSFPYKIISPENFHKSLAVENTEDKKVVLKPNQISIYSNSSLYGLKRKEGDSFFMREANPEIFEVNHLQINNYTVGKEDEKTILAILRRAKPNTESHLDLKGDRIPYATIIIKNKVLPYRSSRIIPIFTDKPQTFIWYEDDFENLISIIDKYIK